MVGLGSAGADPLVEPRQPGRVLAGLVEHVGPRVHGVPGRRLDRQGVRRERLGLAPSLLVLAHEGQLAGVPPVVAVAPSQALDEVGGLAAGGEAAERDGRHRHAHGEGVPGEEPDVAEQGGSTRGLVRAEPDRDRVQEADLAVVEVVVRGGGVRRAQRAAPGAGGAPLVPQQRQCRVRLREPGVQRRGLLESGLDAVLQPEQASERLVVGVRCLAVGRQGEAVDVDRPAPGLAVQPAYDGPGHVVGLLADLGHRRGLPQVAASQRTEGVERHPGREYAEHPSVVRGVDAQSRRAGTDQAGVCQRGEQRVLGERPDGPGAVHDARDVDLAAVGQRDLETRPATAGPTRPSRCAGRGGRRRRSRPAGVRSPATSGAGGSPTCERARRRNRRLSSSQRPCHSCAVTGRRPSIAARQSPVSSTVRLDVGVDDALQLLERADAGDARRWRHQRGGRHPVRRGHQVVPRDRVQGPPRTVRSDRDVDHGQSGADQQEVAVGQLVGPGVRDVGTAEPGRCPVGARRGPGGEYDGAGDDRLPRREAHREPVTASGDPDHGFLAAFEAGVAGVLRRGLQQAVDVVAVHRARDEVLRLRLRVVVVAHPAEEVLGVPREGAHPAGGDVEQVAFVGRGVRRPAAGRGGGVDQGDPVPRRQAGHQVGGRQRPRSTSPHHDDTAVAFASAHRIRL